MLAVVTGAVLAMSCARDHEAQARRYAARGDAFAEQGRDKAALLEYRNAVRASGASTEARWKLGDTLARLGRTTEAYRAYAQALRVVGGEELPHDEAGLRAVVNSRPALVPARLLLADLLLSRQDPRGAEVQLRAATAIEPGNELAHRALAALLIADNRLDEAEECLRIAAAQDPQRYRSHLALVDFLVEQGRYAEARTRLEQARRDPWLTAEVRMRVEAIAGEEGKTVE